MPAMTRPWHLVALAPRPDGAAWLVQREGALAPPAWEGGWRRCPSWVILPSRPLLFCAAGWA